MNYTINNLPERTVKPRQNGLTMVMDKGLSLRGVEDLIETAGSNTDVVKLGWATSYVSPNLDAKLKLYKEAGLPVYFGGTLFEAMIVRGQFDDYCRILDKYQMEYAEVSDGSITIEHDIKCEYIRKLSKQITVISEVGSKDVQKIFAPYKWIQLMKAELKPVRGKLLPRPAKAAT
jgi:phosphosulfolactate synthase